jgi:hypothetical protein
LHTQHVGGSLLADRSRHLREREMGVHSELSLRSARQ